MIIDFHTHIFPDDMAEKTLRGMSKITNLAPFMNGTEHGLLESMGKSGVEYSVILPVATKAKQFHTINAFAKKINDTYAHIKGPKLISFGGIHPDSSDYKAQLREIVNFGFKGIKLHPDYQNTMIEDIKYMRLIDYASELGLIISIHAGIDAGYPNTVHCTVKGARKVLDEVKPQKLILAHFGGYGLWDEVEELLVGQNVYLDTGFIFHKIQPEQFKRMVTNHGSEHILFATDAPWGGQKESIDTLENWGLSEEEKGNVFYKNASKLLEL